MESGPKIIKNKNRRKRKRKKKNKEKEEIVEKPQEKEEMNEKKEGEDEESFYSRKSLKEQITSHTQDYWKDDDGFAEKKEEEQEEFKWNSDDEEKARAEWDEWGDDPVEQENKPSKPRRKRSSSINLDADEDNYLKVEDLSDNYTIHYLVEINEEFQQSVETLKNAELVGIDTEFEQNKGARYIQISTDTEGFIFNLYKLQFEDECRNFFKEFLGNEKIRKMGFNVSQDIKAIRRAFQNKKGYEGKGFEELEDVLFMGRTSNQLGLSDLCNRVFGKN